jgi:hypothetical protein
LKTKLTPKNQDIKNNCYGTNGTINQTNSSSQFKIEHCQSTKSLTSAFSGPFSFAIQSRVLPLFEVLGLEKRQTYLAATYKSR